MSEFEKTNEKIAEGAVKGYKNIETGVVKGYKAIENGVVGGYKKIENGAVEGFNKVSDKFVEKLFAREGETVEQAKERLARQAAAQRGADPAGKEPGDAL